MTPKKTRSKATAEDLTRISGVGPEYSDLLESAGVDTVRELRSRDAAKLTARLTKVNKRRMLVRRVPSQSMVEGWIDKAEELEPSFKFGIRRARQMWADQRSKLRAALGEDVNDKISELRDQLEGALDSWRESFNPAAETPAAKKTAAKKPTARRMPIDDT